MSHEPAPILTIQLPVLTTWEQSQGGGCRCCCRIYHPGLSTSGISTCTAAAEPDLLITLAAGTETHGPLPVCRRCYSALSPDQD
ncbi:DUF6372 family protein [Nocardia asteroides]|uniref:DUF6372 family protein n=1 Tax=Nocardia asteroides TaxID=1824 RepID=UPI0033E49827